MRKAVVMSDKYSCFCRCMSELGFDVIPSDTVKVFPNPEQKHTDMQLLNIGGKYFLLRECLSLRRSLNNLNLDLTVCEKEAGERYPENILLNFLYINNTIYGKTAFAAEEVLQYCKENQIRIVNINQGYARCSSLVLNDSSVITSDQSIEQALNRDGIKVLRISAGQIALDGYDYGFIGGASAVLCDDVVFFGDIKAHDCCEKIRNFISDSGLNMKILCEDMPLTDIGGAVLLNNQGGHF